MIRLILGGMIGAMLFASVVKAEEQKTVTPKEFVETVVADQAKFLHTCRTSG